MRKIKIGIFVDGDFIPSYDGASNRFHYLSRYLVLNGADVVVFHGYRSWSDIKLIKNEPFKTYIFPKSQYYSNLELIASLIKKESIDIIQFDNLEPILLQGIRLSKLTATKLVSEMHYVVRNLAKKLGADMPRLEEIKTMEEMVGKSVDHLISLSEEDKIILEKYMGMSPQRISVIPSGVDCSEIRYFGPNFDEKNIIFLGNLYFKPNEDAVRIMRNLIYPELQQYGFRFTIAGDCPPELKKDCHTKDFDFIGTLPDLNLLFKDATFALAPINEGTGMRIKLLNYLAAGIPILTSSTATSGFKNKNHFFIEDDYSCYGKRILDLLKNKGDLTRTSYDGRSEIDKYYDWGNIAKTTIGVYEKVLNKDTIEKILPNNNVIKNDEPAWLQEAIAKKRFKDISSDELSEGFSFAVINNNSVNSYQLEKIIALEGMPGAGKTTFINQYTNNENIIFVPQLQIEEKILSKDNVETSKQFLFAEQKKTEQILALGKQYSEIVIDRTFFTTLAYCYARSKVNNTQEEYISLLRVYEGIKHTIIFPTHVIFLDVSIEESIKRRLSYSEDIRYKNWFDPVFLGYLKEFYNTELKKFFPEVLSHIDTNDLKVEDVANKINEVLCKKEI